MPTKTTSETLTRGSDAVPLTVCRGGEGPAVVIVPSIFGVAPDLVEQMEEIAEHGATVIAMDPFFRTKPGPHPYTDPSGAIARMNATDLDATRADYDALLPHARSLGNGKVLGVGICFGGPFCFVAGAAGKLDGIVTWHGSRLDRYLDEARKLKCPVRLHFGAADPVVPLSAVEAVRTALSAHPDARIEVHPGAGHGFSHRTAAAHDKAAELAGMNAVHELVAALKKNGGAQP